MKLSIFLEQKKYEFGQQKKHKPSETMFKSLTWIRVSESEEQLIN